MGWCIAPRDQNPVPHTGRPFGFRTKSIPEHRRLGMKILGPYLSIDDPDRFFFMRGFPDMASREPMKASFYEGDLWKRELESVLMPMIDKYEVVLVDDSENTIHW